MHILLVEDESRLASAVKRALGEEGHVIDWVADGIDAYTQARTEQYDLLILDIMLPGMDGFEIARRLRKDGETAPMLMLTARDAVADRVKGLDLGADDYMVKPFALSELLARVRAFQRRASAVPGSTSLSVANLTLDLRSREAIREGKRIELTSKEFALLELLMRSPGQVFTRSQILDRVWSLDAQIESNVLETYIHYLRNKVDRGYEPQLIRTVRGVGYSIKEP